MTELTLYSANPSRGLVVEWLLAELNVPYQLIHLDFEKEEQKSTTYLSLNPMGKVPTLLVQQGTTSTQVITETSAICLYLADAYPQKRLSVPIESPLRGELLRWCFFAPVTMEPAIVTTALNMRNDDYQPFADLDSIADTLCHALANHSYIVGDRFSVADIAIGSAVYWGLNLMPVLPKRGLIEDYWSRLEQRPAWQKTIQTNAHN